MTGEGAEVVHIPPGAARVPVQVVTGASLPDDHEVGHTATAGRHRIDGVVHTVSQGGTTVGVLADVALQGDVEKTSLASQTLSYGQ